jgi:hypothetical protein
MPAGVCLGEASWGGLQPTLSAETPPASSAKPRQLFLRHHRTLPAILSSPVGATATPLSLTTERS